MLETRSLSMHFGGVVAVDRVDFSLRENEDGYKLFLMQVGLLKNFDKEIES